MSGPEAAAVAARSADILVVDDDAGVAECVQAILKQAGHKPVLCDNAEEGLVRLHSDAFDLVVTDLKLPGKSGLEVVRAVKERGDDTPVILMTSYSSVE